MITAVLWAVKNWRISLYAVFAILVIGAYFKGYSTGEKASAAETLKVASQIREKQDRILADKPDVAGVIKRLHQHKF